ncbi:unnamed protein product [Closterium sp. NIES-54]
MDRRSYRSISSSFCRWGRAGRQRGGGAGPCTYVLRTGDRAGEQCGGLHSTHRCFGRLTDAWHHQFPDATEIPRWGDLSRAGVAVFDLDYDAILAARYALSTSDEGDCYLCVPPDSGIEAAALGAGEPAALGASAYAAPGAGESTPSGTASAQVLHTFTLDSGASRSFFRDCTTLTPLNRPVAVSLADPSGGPVLASFSTVLLCPAAPSGSLSGLYLPSFSTNLVSGADLQDQGVDQFTPASQRVTHCTCARTGRHLATFTRRPGSSLYTLSTESPPVSASSQVAASSQVLAAASASGLESAPCSCRLLSHQTLLWHHRLGHPSLPRLRGMASRVLRAAPHSSVFPPTEAPLQTLHMDVWGPARVRGQGHERYFLLVVDDYSRYTTVFPLRSKGEVSEPSRSAWRSSRLRSSESSWWSRSSRSWRSCSWGSCSSSSSWRSRSSCWGCGPFGERIEDASLIEGGAASWRPPVEPGGVEPGGTEPGGAEPRAGGTTAATRSGGTCPGGAGAAGPGGTTEAAGVGPTGGSAGASDGLGDAGSAGPGAAQATGVGAAGGVGAGGSAAAGTSEGAGAGATGAGAPAGSPGALPAGSGGASRPRPYFVPLLEQPVSPLPAPSPYTGPTGGLAERRAPASRPASPARPACTSRRTSRPRPPAVPGTHHMALRPSTAPLRVLLPSPPASSLPAFRDPESDSLRAASPTVARFLATVVTDPSLVSTAASALVAELVDFAARCRLVYAASLVAESTSVCPPSVGGECAFSTDVLEDRQEEFQCFAAALPHLVSTLLAPEGDPDAPDIPTPRSYAEAIEGPYSSQWQAAMDAEMASWKSTGTYVDEVHPPGANIVSGMWIFRVKRPPGSPPVFKARYVARGFSQRQGVDYFQTFSPTLKMTTLRVLLHVAAQRDYELQSLDFSTAFLLGSLHEEIWLRRPPGFTGSFPPGTQTTLAALGFAPSTADSSLFLRTDTSLPPFYVLVYVDDLVFATADTAGLAHVKSELQKRHTCTDLGELRSYLGLQITRDRAQRTITLTQSHIVQQVLQRFDFTYSSPQATPLSTRHSLSALPSDESVEPSGPYPELVGCLITKHIALRYFLARELQQRGQLRLAYVASEANTTDIFTKALPPGDHQRFCTMLGFPTCTQLILLVHSFLFLHW